MQMTQDGDHHGPSSIIFMPMIDQKSTDPMCILSTMNFVCTLAQRYSVVPVLTFDQPLYWKAMELQASQESESTMKSCVLRLGGFHMCMSFLGAIGHIMQGSGLSSIFELIYAEGSVPAIMGGKEMSRGTRAHILLYGTLMGLIILKIFAQNTSNVFDQESIDLPPVLIELKNMAQMILSNEKRIGRYRKFGTSPFSSNRQYN